MRGAVLAAWLLRACASLAFMPAAQAHPHGALDCAVRLGVEQGRLGWVQQRLTLDEANTQALAERLQLDVAEPQRAAQQFRALLEGLFRQSGWMLQLRAAGASTPLVLDDPDAPTWTRDAQGRAVVTVRLLPAETDGVPDGLQLACSDPSWYWAAGFAGPEPLQLQGAACQARIGHATALAEQAQALRAAALQAGNAGADQVQPGLLQSGALRSANAAVQC